MWRASGASMAGCSTTAERKAALGFEKADDGIFWMKFEDFALVFNEFSILFLKPGWERRALSQATPVAATKRLR